MPSPLSQFLADPLRRDAQEMSPHQLKLAGPERQRKNVVRVTPASLDQTYPNSDIVDMKPRARQQ